ncbi:hypothetical protein CHS0354_011153 [Potamilus streckersoni]|uniref:Protein AATF n=1 Tax=Potamilus streckersoni TaxID=2493646 RepID=A0AAE0S0T6_9BIVA|nr:hypothetical protein CHS0354_011153 [Potamilus streckersoni]
MASLLDEIAKLVDTTPAFPDPEDDARDDTSARVIEKGEENFEHETRTSQPSKLRQKVGLSLADFGSKYAGKKTSRKKLMESEGDESIDSEEAESDYLQMSDNNSDSVSNDDDVSDEKNSEDQDDRELERFKAKLNKSNVLPQEFSFDAGGNFSQYADDFEDEEKSDESEDEDHGGDDEDEDSESALEEEGDGDEVDDSEEEKGFQQFSKTSASDEVAKGLASRQQLGLWDSLVEARIKLQKAVAIINQLPHPDAWRKMEQTGEDSFTVEANKAQLAVKALLDNLIQLQTLLLLQNMETRHIVNSNQSEKIDKGSKSSKTDVEDDEEITSESDMEVDKTLSTAPSVSSPLAKPKKRKLQTAVFPECLEKRHKAFSEFRDSTIQKWNDKTRLAGGKIKGKSFSAFEQSALAQIQQIMSDKERLIRRTQLKRSVYQVVGQPEKLQKDEDKIAFEQEGEDPSSSKDNLQDYDPEIFDDDDFYHQLLRELIERKTSEISDPIALSRQWLEIQKLRKKVKKKVDTKASKGRKIRYDIHKKLINFMAQYENSTWPDESRDDLFKSLFGKRFQSIETEEQ